ncbi:unnamed protein product [Gadus morhua 'NCC']
MPLGAGAGGPGGVGGEYKSDQGSALGGRIQGPSSVVVSGECVSGGQTDDIAWCRLGFVQLIQCGLTTKANKAEAPPSSGIDAPKPPLLWRLVCGEEWGRPARFKAAMTPGGLSTAGGETETTSAQFGPTSSFCHCSVGRVLPTGPYFPLQMVNGNT